MTLSLMEPHGQARSPRNNTHLRPASGVTYSSTAKAVPARRSGCAQADEKFY